MAPHADKSPPRSEKSLIATISRFTAFAKIEERDLGDLMTLTGGTRSVKKGEYIFHEGDKPDGFSLLLSGWTASSVTFACGARQMLKVHLPGDMLGLPSLALTRYADSIVALTPVEIGLMPRASFGRLFELNPRLAALLFLISQEERINMMDRLASVGATDAVNRLAALFLQIHTRVVRSDPSIGDSFAFPLLQGDVADLIGVTTVHLNRTVKQMRADKLIAWSRGTLTLLDRPGLVELAGLPERVLDRDAEWLPARRIP